MTPRRRPSSLGERITWKPEDVTILAAERRAELEQQLRDAGLSEEQIADAVANARGDPTDTAIRDSRRRPRIRSPLRRAPHTHRRARRHTRHAVPPRTTPPRCKPFCGDRAAT